MTARSIALGVMMLSLAACTGASPAAPSSPLASVVGTPWLIAFKVPVCAASLALAGPLIAGRTLAVQGPDANLAEAGIGRDLDRGLDQNCGPPYGVGP